MNGPVKGAQTFNPNETYPNYANNPAHPNGQFTRNLEEKCYRRIDKFLSGEAEWQEFKFDVLITTRTLNTELANKMEEVTRNLQLFKVIMDTSGR